MSATSDYPPVNRQAASAEKEAFRYIIDTIGERAGIRLHEGKESLIQARLGKRMRLLGMATLTEYCHYLRSPGNDHEYEFVVNALTTNFTNFLREPDHFQFMVNAGLASLQEKKQKKFRIWSAACSTGEEPYTIAFYLWEKFALTAGWDWSITATDLSTRALEKAKLALYQEDRIQTVPREWLHKFFQKGFGAWAGHYRIKQAISGRVDFHQLNLIEEYTQPNTYEIIFCRNVMIYFDRPTQERLVNRLCQYLVPGGYLFIGHSESLNGQRVPLRCVSPSIYQRNAN